MAYFSVRFYVYVFVILTWLKYITIEMVFRSCHTIPVILKMSIIKGEKYDFTIVNTTIKNIRPRFVRLN